MVNIMVKNKWLLVFLIAILLNGSVGVAVGYIIGREDMASYHMAISIQQRRIKELVDEKATLQDRIDRANHSIMHYNEQAKAYYTENQRMHEELINSELYELDYEYVSDNITFRSYKKVSK